MHSVNPWRVGLPLYAHSKGIYHHMKDVDKEREFDKYLSQTHFLLKSP